MSTAVETPAPHDAPEPAPEQRSCPRCGSPLRPEQEWCLNCGAGIGAQVAAPRGWRWPVAAIGTLLALMLIAVVLALVELSGGAETITPPPATTPAPQAAATPAPTAAAPSASTDPSQVPPSSGGTAATPQVSDWPAGKTGYTVMLDSSASQPSAAARAKDLSAQGIPVGMLDTSGYRPFTHDRYVIFSGQYTTRAEARAAAQSFANRVTGAKVVRIAPA